MPDSELDGWGELGFTHLWLMGVWRSGFRARAVARAIPELVEACGSLRAVGPSPYAIGGYEVPVTFGGNDGLAMFRRRLHQRGMKLLLDFVPNHVGLDHPWVFERPQIFVRSASEAPGFFALKGREMFLAHGKDPHFPAWADTVQLDYRLVEAREAMVAQLRQIAAHCDGVRCDMAMLILSDIFEQSWRRHPPMDGTIAGGEFWPRAIAATRSRFPGFLFLAEVYWNKEARLQEMGFDYTYDKVLYDYLVREEPERAKRHLLSAAPGYVEHSAHFLENHDEPRVANLLEQARHETAALLTFAVPGMRLLHEGQLTGARAKLPVQALWGPNEARDEAIESFYRHLFAMLLVEAQGSWKLLSPDAETSVSAASVVFLIYGTWREPDLLVGVNLAICHSSVRTQWKVIDGGKVSGPFECLLTAGNHQGITAGVGADSGVWLSLPGRSGGVWRLPRKRLNRDQRDQFATVRS